MKNTEKTFLVTYKGKTSNSWFSGGSDTECKKSILWSIRDLNEDNSITMKDIKIVKV